MSRNPIESEYLNKTLDTQLMRKYSLQQSFKRPKSAIKTKNTNRKLGLNSYGIQNSKYLKNLNQYDRNLDKFGYLFENYSNLKVIPRTPLVRGLSSIHYVAPQKLYQHEMCTKD